MKLFNYIKSLWGNKIQDDSEETTEPMFTISQCANKKGVTRQAIFFAIKMKRLNARQQNGTWLISDKDLTDYFDNKYSRSKSRKEGKLIFDKTKGFYSIAEVAKLLGKNTNHVYYLVRMGRLKTHRQGSAIVIENGELHKYVEFNDKKLQKNLNHA